MFKKAQITIIPGTQPNSDNTALNTVNCTETDKVFFFDNLLTSLPGWISVVAGNLVDIYGAARNIFSYIVGKPRALIGTSAAVYVYVDGNLTNITPLQVATIAIANSLDSNYGTLANNPLATVLDSPTITVSSTAHVLEVGDIVTLSGASTTNGIPNTEINTFHVVQSVAVNSYTITVTTEATSTGSGGGASVVEATRIITVNAAAHGMEDGERVGIAGAATFAGIPNTDINIEHVIRNVTTNTFDIAVNTTATSSVTAGGGASTTYRKQITSGNIDIGTGSGYGGGLYGAGTYGTAKEFGAGLITYPRIWSMDRFGNDIVMTPGDDGEVYIWQNDLDVAPALLANAPTALWTFVSNNTVVVLGADGVTNSIAASDTGDGTAWTPSASSNAYYDEVEGIGRWVSQARSRSTDILFTEQEVFTFQFVGKPNIWDLSEIFSSDGIIGPKARASVNGMVYWMGQTDFYYYDGASVQQIPNITCYDYIFDNLNYAQRWKCFTRVETQNNQVWFYFPTGTSLECNEYVIFDYASGHWTLGTMDRTAAEEPTTTFQYPLMVNSTSDDTAGNLYFHNFGNDDDGSPMESYAITNYVQLGEGDKVFEIQQITPDSSQVGNVDFSIYMKDYPQSAEEFEYSGYVISTEYNFTDVRACGRQRKYKISKNGLGEFFRIGKWYEGIVERGFR